MNWILIVGCFAGALEVGLFLLAIYVIRQQRKILGRFHARRAEDSAILLSVAPPNDDVELLSKHNLEWVHHSFRPAGHRDIEEALATPGLAIRKDGVITEGAQDAV